MKKNLILFRNIKFGIISKLVSSILEFISRYYFIKILGSEVLGISNVMVNIIQLFSLAELGLINVATFSYYSPIANKDYKKISQLNIFFRKIFNRVSIFVFIFGLVLTPFVPKIINSSVDNGILYFYFFLLLLDTVFSYVYIYKVIFLTADQKGYLSNKIDIYINILRVTLQTISLIFLKSFIIYLLIKLASTIISNLLKSKQTDKLYPILIKNPSDTESVINEAELIDNIKSGFIYKFSGVLLHSVDNILISTLVNTTIVGLLSNYNVIISTVTQFIVVGFNALAPSVGNDLIKRSKQDINRLFNKIQTISLWISIVVISNLYILSDDFVKLWIGEAFVLPASILIAKLSYTYIFCVLQPIYQFRDGSGLFLKTKNIIVLAAAINLVLSVILGVYFGVVGILTATSVSIVLTYFWFEPYLMFKEYLGLSLVKYFSRIVINLCSIVLFIYIIKNINLFIISSWADWIVYGIIVFIASNIFAFILYYKSLLKD